MATDKTEAKLITYEADGRSVTERVARYSPGGQAGFAGALFAFFVTESGRRVRAIDVLEWRAR